MSKASWALSDVFGRGHVYVPTPCFDAPQWLPTDRRALDFLTGAELALAGDFPIVCHRAVSTPAALSLLEEAGHPRPSQILQYADAESYSKLLGDLVAQGRTIVLQHAHPKGVLPERSLWVPSSLLCFLNNKANLREFVPALQTPERRIVSRAHLESMPASQLRPPLVLKAAEDVSSGAGCGVAVCRTAVDVEEAKRMLAHCQAVAVEEFVHFEISWCVQYFVSPNGSIRYAGAAEQICEPSGAYRGNWLVEPDTTPRGVLTIAREITERVADRGYRGFLGIDIGLTRDGRLLAFDLNARFTGSAVALSVFPGLSASGTRVSRCGTWVGQGDFESLEHVVRDAMSRGRFMPLAFFDPRDSDAQAPPRVKGLLLGQTREEVVLYEKDFAVAGLR